ncbi:MAG: hypothetical protein DWQ19_09320 [Crenarchaeota archaeon]|nr:MAG: hypothetical protein DWQ19_09320 [Thermoproteota archaeon]
MEDFREYLDNKAVSTSAEEAIEIIKELSGRLNSTQWDRLISLIKRFANKHTDKSGYSIGWNLSGTKYGPPSQPPSQEPRTLGPS